MTRSGVGVAVVALILGGIAVGWLAYSQFIMPTQNIKTIFSAGNLYCTPADTNKTIPNFTLNFTLGAGQRVYITFSCELVLFVNSADLDSQFYAYFVLNGTTLNSPFCEERAPQSTVANYDFRSVYVAFSPDLNWLSAGNQNVTIQIRGSQANNRIYNNRLTVEIFSA